MKRIIPFVVWLCVSVAFAGSEVEFAQALYQQMDADAAQVRQECMAAFSQLSKLDMKDETQFWQEVAALRQAFGQLDYTKLTEMQRAADSLRSHFPEGSKQHIRLSDMLDELGALHATAWQWYELFAIIIARQEMIVSFPDVGNHALQYEQFRGLAAIATKLVPVEKDLDYLRLKSLLIERGFNKLAWGRKILRVFNKHTKQLDASFFTEQEFNRVEARKAWTRGMLRRLAARKITLMNAVFTLCFADTVRIRLACFKSGTGDAEAAGMAASQLMLFFWERYQPELLRYDYLKREFKR